MRWANSLLSPIQKLALTLDVERASKALEKSIRWNSHQHRTNDSTSPHRAADDIWLRYGSLDDEQLRKGQPFISDWYPYPELRVLLEPLVNQVYDHVGGLELGGCLITATPAGKSVLPHTDKGWHASYYSKYCVCLRANEAQSFCFKEHSLRTVSGEVFFFDNSHQHWVLNPSTEDRMSMIVCVKTDRGIHQP